MPEFNSVESVRERAEASHREAVSLIQTGHSQEYWDSLWAKFAQTSAQKRRIQREYAGRTK